MNQFMMNQFAAAVNNKNNGMDVPFAGTQQGMINPQTLMYQNQLMYQALQDPATVAYLIQQQQQLQVQLQQQAQAQLLARNQEKPANITDLWAQRSQQLFGASGNQKFGKSGRGSSTTKKNLNKMPKMRPDEGEMILPDAETQQAIIEAAEMYFSNENLAKDHYLLRQICQKSEGYLSIKLLTALKNVKKLTKDWRVTAYCLKKSSKLQLNEEETKVRRIDALPEYVLKARSITNVLCIKMPNHLGSVGAVTSMFSEYGRISLVRVLLEGKPVPCDLRNYATQVPDMGSTLCAVVEFESEEEATNCVKQLNSRQSENEMRAALLGPRLRRNLYKIPTEEEKAEELMKLAANTKLEGGDSGCDSASLGDDADVSGGVSDASSTPAETLKAKKLIKRKDRQSDDLVSVTSSEDHYETGRAWGKSVASTSSSAISSDATATTDSEKSNYRFRQLAVLREPRGPDGSKGFNRTFRRQAEPMKA
jgi:hypothetical protein